MSVRELITAFGRAAGRELPVEVLPRRAGDIAASYCDPSKAQAELDWVATRTIDDACRDSWNWQSQNPNGYASA